MFFKSKTRTSPLAESGRKLTDDVLQTAEQAVVNAGAQVRAACSDSERMAQQARQFVAEQPLRSVLVASAAGALLIGALWASTRTHS